MSRKQQKLTDLLNEIDIQVGGDRPWDIAIHDERFYQAVLAKPSIGLGESYMQGWWDCVALDTFFMKVLHQLDLKKVYKFTTIAYVLAKDLLLNQQTQLRAKRVAKVHYNLDNNLYQKMLGESMAYTCGYWQQAADLQEAQFAKYDLVCRKLNITAGDRVLELGCGFGGFAKFAAEHYGCEMHSVNISTEQLKYARQICEGLPVHLFECDYRNEAFYNPNKIKFDKVVSIGMCEHVGYKNYRQFLQIARNQLKEDGLFLMHTIGKNQTTLFSDPWIRKYIFPSGMLPTIQLLSKAAEGLFVIEDLHNFGADYDRTLMAWNTNFEVHWDELKSNYDEVFYRMWRYYLLSCAGAFRARELQLWQFVFSSKGVINGYTSIR